jgi:DNA-binding MarR family transcriptional regulator
MGQALSRIATGLVMIGVAEKDIKPYLNRLVFNSMTRIRASVIRAWMGGLSKQTEIAARLDVSQGTISRVIEDIKILGWSDNWLETLNGRTN